MEDEFKRLLDIVKTASESITALPTDKIIIIAFNEVGIYAILDTLSSTVEAAEVLSIISSDIIKQNN